jgi:hypothetical protein
MNNSTTKYRKFQICDIYGNAVTTPFTGKQSSFSRDISFAAGTNVSLYAIEIPHNAGSTSLYSINNYIQSSSGPASSAVFVPSKLNITGGSTSGTGKNAVKTIKLTITGWPQGAPYHFVVFYLHLYLWVNADGARHQIWHCSLFTDSYSAKKGVGVAENPRSGVGARGSSVKKG